MSVTKYQLFTEKSDWTAKNEEIDSFLSLPIGTTLTYGQPDTVQNPDSSDFGKFIMPVMFIGTWKCDDQFNASDLVDWQADWDIPVPTPTK